MSQTTPAAPDEAADHSPKPASPTFFSHLLDGLNSMIPFVVAGGILMAIGFAVDAADAMSYPESGLGSIGQVLYLIGNSHAMGLMFAVLSGFIARSIGGDAAFVAGMVGGSIAAANGSTFLGGVVSGILAGYLIKLANNKIRIPSSLQTVWSILVLPVVSVLAVGLASFYVIGTPVSWVMEKLTSLLSGMQGGSMLLLCAVLGAMMAVDLAGPILRVAYFFAVAAVAAEPGVPQAVMAAVIVGGMIPPLGMALASAIQKSKFTKSEVVAGQAAWILGASLINEGFIPFALRDPKRVLPSTAVGAAIGGAIVGLTGTGTTVVHGGLFIVPIPGAVANPVGYLVATAVGTLVTAALVLLLKRPLPESARSETQTP
ncbi:MAG: PTS fructose transporter subunit IIC [Bifidobacteriaceae bacterium]|jgi:PTS system fructose-specific IIC component|nr:PTS fructose transporter subunit IIC [Bifidobacteriaceae bacterium]